MLWAVSPLGVMGWGWEMGPRRPFCWLTAPEPGGKKGRRETEQAKTDARGTWDRKKLKRRGMWPREGHTGVGGAVVRARPEGPGEGTDPSSS